MGRHGGTGVVLNSADVDRVLEDIRYRLGSLEKRAPNVLANAMNQTITQLKKFVPKQIATEYSYKQKLQMPRMQRASYKKLRAALYYDPIKKEELAKISFDQFDYKLGVPGFERCQPGRQFQARIRYDEGFHDKPRVFENLKTGIIMKRKRGEVKYPIFRALGPSEPTMVRAVWRGERAQEFTTNMLGKKLDEQIKKQYLKKWGLK